jgi:hypothetical protein
MNILTFLTDFGIKNNYVAQMKAVALRITETKIVDITHNVTPHNINEGAFLLKTSVPHFPDGTVHVAVVDPGVGTDRRGIVVTTKKQILVGPDNGLLIPVAKHLGEFQVYEIKNKELLRNNISNTFHGRDIFTPVAAHILNGIYFNQIGPRIFDYKKLDRESFIIKEKTAEGVIIHIDEFGNIITSIDGVKLRSKINFNEKIMVYIGKKRIEIPFVKTYGEIKKNETLATIGSNNLFEISINQGKASKKYKAKLGDKIKILF